MKNGIKRNFVKWLNVSGLAKSKENKCKKKTKKRTAVLKKYLTLQRFNKRMIVLQI